MTAQDKGRSARRKATSRSGYAGSSERPTLGFFLTWMRDVYENGLALGAFAAAEELGANLVCFEGQELYDQHRMMSVIYDLATPERFDGLILSGTLGHSLNSDNLHAFCARYAPMPIVGLGMQNAGLIGLLADSYSGMYKAVTHLIEHHGYRRIAFIQGPAGQLEAEDRFRAYTDALAAHAIPLNPAWLARGTYAYGTGRTAMEQNLGWIGAVQAIVAANDEMALGAFHILQARGISVPEEIALVGFDDREAVQHLSVPFTTVRQPLDKIGRLAVETLLQAIAGKEQPAIITVPTELIVRRSCGCMSDAIERAVVVTAPAAALPLTDLPAPADVPVEVYTAFLAGLAAESGERFVAAVDQHLRQAHHAVQSLETVPITGFAPWQNLLSVLRAHVVPYLTDRQQLVRAENMLQQARLLISDATQRLEGYRRLLMLEREGVTQNMERALSTVMEFEDLPAVFVEHFAQMGIAWARLMLYAGEQPPFTRARQLLSYEKGGGAKLQVDAPTFSVRRLLPDNIVHTGNMVVVGLVLRDRHLGYAVLDFGVRTSDLYGRLREQLSSALFRIALVKQQTLARQELEAARQRSEIALRDLLVLQQRYVREAWEIYAPASQGYQITPTASAPTTTAWLPVMEAAVRADDLVVARAAEHGAMLGIPLTLYGEVIGVLGFSRPDAQEWEAHELALLKSVAGQLAQALETQRLLADIRRRALQLNTAAEVARVTTSILSLEELLPRAVNLIREGLELYYVGIFIVEETGRWAVLRAGTGEAGRIMLERGHRLEVGGASMIGTCIAGGRARIALDVGAEAVRFSNPYLPDTHSEMALPLFSRGRVIGAMTIQATQTAAFSDEDITTLQTMADQLGNALVNARLITEMEANVRALEAAQGQYTLESWRKYLESTGGALGYRYRFGLEPASAPSPEAQQALAQKQLVMAQYKDAEAADAEYRAVAVPLRLREQVIGALNIRFDTEHVPAETLALVEQVAEQAALALESARLYQDSQRRAVQERLVSEVTARIRETLSLDMVMQTAAREIAQALSLYDLTIQFDPEAEFEA